MPKKLSDKEKIKYLRKDVNFFFVLYILMSITAVAFISLASFTGYDRNIIRNELHTSYNQLCQDRYGESFISSTYSKDPNVHQIKVECSTNSFVIQYMDIRSDMMKTSTEYQTPYYIYKNGRILDYRNQGDHSSTQSYYDKPITVNPFTCTPNGDTLNCITDYRAG